MFATLRRILGPLNLEEKILHAGALVGMIGVLCPWIGGEWLGGTSVLHTGFGFYTSFLGLAVFLLNGFIVFETFSPLLRGPALLRREHRTMAQLLAGAQAVVLSLAALSVLTRVAFEFSRVEIRFGIYTSLIGSLTVTLYAFLRFQEERRQNAQSFFHHEEPEAPLTMTRGSGPTERQEVIQRIKEEVLHVPSASPPPPPPPSPPLVVPKAPAVEEHPIFRGL